MQDETQQRPEATIYTPPAPQPMLSVRWELGMPTPNLDTALATAQGLFKPVPKTKTARVKYKNSDREYTYNYADLADVLSMALPIMGPLGLSIRQPFKGEGAGRLVVTELHHSSGEWCSDDGLPLLASVPPQEFGSQNTYWRRYGACNMLGISPDADEDGKMANDSAKERQQGQGRKAGQTAKPAEERGGDGPELIDDQQAKHWNKTRKDAGWSVEQAADFCRRWGGLRGMPASEYEQAVRWATTGPQTEEEKRKSAADRAKASGTKAAENPTSAGTTPAAETRPASHAAAPAAGTAVSGATAQGASSAATAAKGKGRLEQPATNSVGLPEYFPDEPGQGGATLDQVQKATFFDTAKKHGKNGDDIDRWLQANGLTTAAQIPVSMLGKALDWATTPEGGPISEDERAARAGFGRLGLNLTEQSAAIDQLGGDWKRIRTRVEAEIRRIEEEG